MITRLERVQYQPVVATEATKSSIVAFPSSIPRTLGRTPYGLYVSLTAGIAGLDTTYLLLSGLAQVGEPTSSALVAIVGFDGGAVSHATSLEHVGLVERHADQEVRRGSTLAVSSTGLAVLKPAHDSTSTFVPSLESILPTMLGNSPVAGRSREPTPEPDTHHTGAVNRRADRGIVFTRSTGSRYCAWQPNLRNESRGEQSPTGAHEHGDPGRSPSSAAKSNNTSVRTGRSDEYQTEYAPPLTGSATYKQNQLPRPSTTRRRSNWTNPALLEA